MNMKDFISSCEKHGNFCRHQYFSCYQSSSLGNALILIALHKVTSIYPPTNLLSRCLAVTDLSVGLYLSTTVCTFYIQWLLPVVSLLTSASIGEDRPLALLLGLRYRHTVTLRRVWVVIVWLRLISARKAAWCTFFEFQKLTEIA